MSAVPRMELAPGYTIARVVNGGWQLAAGHRVAGHRAAADDPGAAVDAMIRLAEAGFTTFDCADVYTGVEELLGRFLRAYGGRGAVQVHTKLVPDRHALAALERRYVERVVDRSLARLGVERLDLVQLHWWDYEVPGYVEAARWLDDLRRAGKVRLLGATNFDVRRLGEIVAAGVPIAAHQVQYSLLDRRPEHGMADFCAAHGIAILCYGTLAGGFLSERWLGAPEPAGPLANRSLVKYRLMIDELGGWPLYQQLLGELARIAARLGVAAANVAARWVLDRPRVAGVLVGARSAAYAASNGRIFDVALGDADRRALAAVLARARGPRGDVFGLERQPGGRHAAIMKTDLNQLGVTV